MYIYIDNKRKNKDFLLDLINKKFGYKNVNIIYNENGKPYLEKNELYFNISHSDKYTVYVFDNKEIGVDIEEIRDYDNILNNALNINVSTNEEFFKEWTKREAIIKYKGLTIKEIYKIDTTKYKFDTIIFDNHVISICNGKKYN